MKRTRARLVIIAVLCVAMAALCGCSNLKSPSVDEAIQKEEQSTSPSVTTPTIATNGTLVVGLKSETVSAPLEMVNSATNDATGLDIDLASAIADELGLSVKFVSVTDAKTAMTKGCDIVMDVKAGESSDVAVVGRYCETAATLFHKGSVSTKTAGDLNGKSVALQKNSTSQKILGRTSLTMTQKEYSNLNEAFDALESGTVDYVLCDAYPGGYLAATYDDISFCGTLDVPTSAGVGVLSSNTALQQAVQKAVDTVSGNGVYSIIRTKWVGTLPTLTSSNQIQGVSISSDTTTTTESTSTETANSTEGDGSGAGSNAATV